MEHRMFNQTYIGARIFWSVIFCFRGLIMKRQAENIKLHNLRKSADVIPFPLELTRAPSRSSQPHDQSAKIYFFLGVRYEHTTPPVTDHELSANRTVSRRRKQSWTLVIIIVLNFILFYLICYYIFMIFYLSIHQSVLQFNTLILWVITIIIYKPILSFWTLPLYWTVNAASREPTFHQFFFRFLVTRTGQFLCSLQGYWWERRIGTKHTDNGITLRLLQDNMQLLNIILLTVRFL